MFFSQRSSLPLSFFFLFSFAFVGGRATGRLRSRLYAFGLFILAHVVAGRAVTSLFGNSLFTEDAVVTCFNINL